MKYEWNEDKNLTNLAKHKVSFELASEVFNDPLHLVVFDRTENTEERWHALGMVYGQVLLLVVHTYKTVSGNEIIRIISARKATKYERRFYEEQ